VIISINSGHWGGNVIRLIIDFEELVKVALKGGHRKRSGWWVKRYGAAGFHGLCMCLGVFP
jgi:hypothetical protein